MPVEKEAAEKLRELLKKNIEGHNLSFEEVEETILLIKELENSTAVETEVIPDMSGTNKDENKLTEGDIVEDEHPPLFVTKSKVPNKHKVVEVTDESAEDVIVSPAEENPENHPRTVADKNPGYPADDKVVKVSPVHSDSVYSYPRQRLKIRE